MTKTVYDPGGRYDRVRPLMYIFIYPVYWLLFGTVLVIGGFGLVMFMGPLGKSGFTVVLGRIAFVSMLAWFFICMPWLAHRATKAHLDRFRPFLAAARDAITEGRMALSSLPVVGCLIAPRFGDAEDHETADP